MPRRALVLALWGLVVLAAVGCRTEEDAHALAAPASQTSSPASSTPSDASPRREAQMVAYRQPTGDERVYRREKTPPGDPVQINGPIFENWPKPQVAILITGDQMGYIEPCGCAGLENQKGGLSRRHTLIKQLEGDGWPLVKLDLGEIIRRFGQQSEIKYQVTAEALKSLGYSAIGWGTGDLRLPAGVLALAANESDGGPSRFVSANVGLFGFESGMGSRYRVIDLGGRKIGVTAVLGDSERKEVHASDEIAVISADEGLAKVMPELKANSDFRVLLAYATPEESKALAKKFPDFDVVVTSHGAEEPPHEAEKIAGTKTLLIELGHKGMFAMVLGLYDDPQQPIRYQRVALDARFKDSPEMKAVMAAYQEQLKALGWQGLGLHPRPLANPANGFVGSAACADCHTHAFEVWEKTPHAHATDTLVNLTPSRQFDPECISCHATGWNPQQFEPLESGFAGLDRTPQLAGNGCENCHGPGKLHVAAESGETPSTDEVLAQLRRGMHAVGTAANNDCGKCHDLDNSPEFSFDKYWPLVEHGEK